MRKQPYENLPETSQPVKQIILTFVSLESWHTLKKKLDALLLAATKIIYFEAHCPNGKLGAQISMAKQHHVCLSTFSYTMRFHCGRCRAANNFILYLYSYIHSPLVYASNAKTLFIIIITLSLCLCYLFKQLIINIRSNIPSFMQCSLQPCHTRKSMKIIISTNRAFQIIQYTHTF